MPVYYPGEHLLPGTVGEFFVWSSFSAAILSTILFFLPLFIRKFNNRSFLNGARGFYLLHVFTLIGSGIVLYYLIFNHYFEYSYVWRYSSRSLPVSYIISCFWAGQEGSFLIWAIWQALIGGVLLFFARDWEKPVMAVIAFSQVFMTSMLLGVEISGIRIGASPFILLRESVDTIAGTIFTHPDYLSILKDGNGLNPLLENIWMTIHPPILFLGYALALVPFAYVIASFLRKDHTGWIKKALPWTLLTLAVLGTGLLLGGAWAYVSLTFGGFWSWDPVENSSLVPWMVLLAGLHFLLIARRQPTSLFSAYFFVGLSYILILYASFLTRSGVLADTSVHSFGGNGMTTQLLVFLFSFLILLTVMMVLYAGRSREKRVNNLLSREFWMFLGSIVVLLAAFQLVFTTSIPVLNSILGTDLAPPANATGFYNRWQAFFVTLVAGFIAFCQFMNYGSNEPKAFLKNALLPLLLSIILSVPFILSGAVRQTSYIILLFFILFCITSSLYNFFLRTSKPRNPAAFMTHMGFMLFLLGIIVTFSNSRTVSTNTSRYDTGDARSNAENLVVMKNDTLYMDGYHVVYTSKEVKGNETQYRIDFLRPGHGKLEKEFSLYPSVNIHPDMGVVYNPSTRHFLNRDYYAYITHVGHEPDYIVIRVIMNPYINILWAGAILMISGFGYAAWRRIRRSGVSST